MIKKEFRFYNTDIRRNRNEILHDILVAAKVGLKSTRLMYTTNLSWEPLIKYLKLAEAGGLIEKIEVPRYEERGSKKPAVVWRTTEKGLKYAQGVYDNSRLFREVEA